MDSRINLSVLLKRGRLCRLYRLSDFFSKSNVDHLEKNSIVDKVDIIAIKVLVVHNSSLLLLFVWPVKLNVPGKVFQFDASAQHVEEFVERFAVLLVGKELFFSDLALFHVDHTEFEVLVHCVQVKVFYNFETL